MESIFYFMNIVFDIVGILFALMTISVFVSVELRSRKMRKVHLLGKESGLKVGVEVEWEKPSGAAVKCQGIHYRIIVATECGKLSYDYCARYFTQDDEESWRVWKKATTSVIMERLAQIFVKEGFVIDPILLFAHIAKKNEEVDRFFMMAKSI